MLGIQTVLGPLHGVVNIGLDYGTRADGQLVGRGDWEVRGLRWRETRFVEEAIAGPLRLNGSWLRIGVSTSSFGGDVAGRAEINVRAPNRGRFELRIERVDLTRLLAPWPEYQARLRGYLGAHLRGSLGADWQGSGTVSLLGASLYGVELSEWRLPMDLSYSPLDRRGMITVHDSTLQFFVGRATAQASLAWGGDTRLDGQMHFFNVELRHLLRPGSELGHYGSGDLSGTLTFGANSLHSVEDLTANLDAKLRQAQALQLPVLQQLVPFLFGRVSSATVFDNGSVRARLAHNIIHVERLALESRLLLLFLQGTVTIPDSRLNLDATVSTGRLIFPSHLQRLVRLTVLTANPIPVGLLLETATHAAHLALYLHITGTARSPTIQIQTLRHLTEEALRFLAF